ncbi:oxidoreductase [Rhodococcus sp. NPDC127530]|uniref:oxidoreductase n=1 Tax=unclassified Rhodococcus (in: high G+C Gram-positive bacteria) TaxID=192944 RepID=UPI00363006B3
MSTWLITGCSSGLGRAFAEEALGRGHNVVATARSTDKIQQFAEGNPETALALALDVTDVDSVRAAVATAEEKFGQIDVLINNAGYGYRAAVEEGDDDDVARLFDTHVHGMVRTVKAVLPGMRARRSGTIVNLSSIGARVTGPGSGYYGAAKSAVEALTSALRKEIAPLGLTATVVEPGAFRTDFSGRSLTESSVVIEDYAETAGKRRKAKDTSDGKQPGDPKKAAAVLVDAVDGGQLPFLLLLGSDAVRVVRGALSDLASDIDAWADTVSVTDIDE